MAAQPIAMPDQLPAEIKALIDTVLGGFNSKDSALYTSAFAGDAVVIDGIAPYRWSGPNAPARWFSDAEKWVHDFGVENETPVCDKIVHAAVVGIMPALSFPRRSSSSLSGNRVAVIRESSPSRSRSKATNGRSGLKPDCSIFLAEQAWGHLS